MSIENTIQGRTSRVTDAIRLPECFLFLARKRIEPPQVAIISAQKGTPILSLKHIFRHDRKSLIFNGGFQRSTTKPTPHERVPFRQEGNAYHRLGIAE